MKKRPIILAAILCIAMTIAAACGSSTINVDITEYASIVFSGYDGQGTAAVGGLYDWELDIYDGLEEKADSQTELLSWLLQLEAAVSYDIDVADGLSNGDIVTLTISVDEEAISEIPVKLTGGTVYATVEGLAEIQTIDLFEDIEITYSGAAPYATVEITGGSGYVNEYYCVDTGFYNGDTITIYAEYNSDDLLADGYAAESDTEQIEVSGLSTYVADLSDIPDTLIARMCSMAETVYPADAYEYKYGSTDHTTINSMEYLGCYFLSNKSSTLYDDDQYANMLCLVYRVSLSSDYDKYGDNTLYVPFCFSDIMLLSDGTCTADIDSCFGYTDQVYKMVDADSYIVSTSSYYGWFFGYLSLDSLFNDIVSENINSYSYESTVTTTE